MTSTPDTAGDHADAGGLEQRRRAARLAGPEEYEAKRHEIIHAASTIFQEKGYQATTLKDVASALDTDRATLYRYISGKEELLREAITECVVEVSEDVRRIALADLPATTKLRMIVQEVLAAYEAYYPQPYIFIQEMLDATWVEDSVWAHRLVTMVREIQGHVVDVVEQGVHDGDLRADIPAELMVNAMLGMVNWTHRWYRPGRKYSSAEVGHTFATVLIDGLRPSRGAVGTEPGPAR